MWLNILRLDVSGNLAGVVFVGIFNPLGGTMRLLFVADGRSPIAINWIRYWIHRGDEVHLVSTFACEPDLELASLKIIPVAFSGVKKAGNGSGLNSNRNPLNGAAAIWLRARFRQWLGPVTIRKAAQRLRGEILDLKPDLVHAMRIPYEGMLAADAYGLVPLIVSVWGNDFTLHAPSSPLMGHYTEWTLKVADGLHADCRRDVRLARQWGFAIDRPAVILPGNGGIDLEIFHPSSEERSEPLVINPRGFRGYVRNDTFFRAIPLVLAQQPDARFVCPAMTGEPQVQRWIAELDIAHAVELLPAQTRPELAELFRCAQVLVSPSTHDGTPNSLLEGMACGCFPVAGDLESIREWITPGQNGLLVDPADPQAVANAILKALKEKDLRHQAAERNTAIIAERAEYHRCMAQAKGFYERVLTGA
jgi:glycosyltransferase involved in cell wall biosynthesis